MRHRTASAELGLEDQCIDYKLEPVPCYYCSTTEGEPELHPNRGTSKYNQSYKGLSILHLCNIMM